MELTLQEPTITPEKHVNNTPQLPELEDNSVLLDDVMEQIFGYPIFEIMVLKHLNRPDTMDLICEEPILADAMEQILGETLPPGIISDNLLQDAMSLLVEMASTYVLVKLVVEAQLKHCTVNLSRIDNMLSYVPKSDLCMVLTPSQQPHTHSQCTPKPAPTSR